MTARPLSSIYESIQGGKGLLDWFGCVPRFHDAEFLDLHLRRKGPSTLRVHSWNMGAITSDGYISLERHAVIEFRIDQIVDLELSDFSSQNVINGLELSRTKLEGDREVYELSMEPCFGLAGIIRAEKISVKYTAGKP